jgi:phosphohistidine phosphatase
MSAILLKSGIIPELIITSKALRALRFAGILADTFGYGRNNLIITDELYLASGSEMLDLIKRITDKNNTVFLIGHNPGITHLANSLCDYNTDNIPTSGVFGIEFEIETWKNAEFGKGKFLLFDFPKKHLNN